MLALASGGIVREVAESIRRAAQSGGARRSEGQGGYGSGSSGNSGQGGHGSEKRGQSGRQQSGHGGYGGSSGGERSGQHSADLRNAAANEEDTVVNTMERMGMSTEDNAVDNKKDTVVDNKMDTVVDNKMDTVVDNKMDTVQIIKAAEEGTTMVKQLAIVNIPKLNY
ncbi:keratin, type I cytoskeletal 9-like isoform X2 [Stegodyphus dumicola]|nr:keratin, type I cytoskeletal 9-like isoform X2 [Stegodyphus dumicola]